MQIRPRAGQTGRTADRQTGRRTHTHTIAHTTPTDAQQRNDSDSQSWQLALLDPIRARGMRAA